MNSTVTVEEHGVLIGGGSQPTYATGVGDLTVLSGGIFAPGSTTQYGSNSVSTAVFLTGSLTMSVGSTLMLDANGTSPGAYSIPGSIVGHDQVVVHGEVTLGGATLVLGGTYGYTFSGPIGASYRLIDNDGTDAIVGTFSGLAQNALLSVGNHTYRISYTGGDGNDLVVTRDNLPPSIDAVGATAEYSEQSYGTLIDNSLQISDFDSEHLMGATIQITGGALSGDRLSNSHQTSGGQSWGDGTGDQIYYSYNFATYTLSLNGRASIAHYREFLSGIHFDNTTSDPTAGGTANTRTITFTINDGTASSSPVTRTVNVYPANDAPAGGDRTVTTSEDNDYTFTVANFGFSDPDDGQPNSLAAVRISSLPAAGTIEYDGVEISSGQVSAGYEVSASDITAGRLTFHPGANGNGTAYASFTFQVRDDGGTANGGVDLDQSPNVITVSVTPVNDAPVAASDIVSVNEDMATTGLGATLAANDTDPENNTLTITGVGNATHGLVSLNGGNPIFTPEANFSGQANFDYTISDGQGGTSTATVTVDVAPVADAPVLAGVDGAGLPVGPDQNLGEPVNNHINDFGAIMVALPDGGYAVTWASERDGDRDVYTQVFNADGTARGSEHRVSDPTDNNASDLPKSVAALADGGYVVTWVSEVDGDGDAVARIYNADGTPRTAELNVSDPVDNNSEDVPTSVVALAGGGYAVTWVTNRNGDQDIYTRVYDANGAAIGDEQNVIDTADNGVNDNFNIVTALSGGGYAVTWYAERDGDGDVFTRTYDADGTPSGPERNASDDTDNDRHDSLISVTALSSGGYVMTWFCNRDGDNDTFIRIYSSDGTPVGGEINVSDPSDNNANDSPDFPSAVTVLAGGRIAVTWDSNSGGDTDIYTRVYEADGTPIGAAQNVSDVSFSTTYDQAQSVIALANGGYVVAWVSDRDGDRDLYSRVYTADGLPAGTEQNVSDPIDNNSFDNGAEVVGLEDGGYVVAWDSNYPNDEGGPDVYARVYNADGAPRSAVFNVSNVPGGLDAGYLTSLTALAGGGFSITLRSIISGDSDVHTRVFDSGAVTGIEDTAIAFPAITAAVSDTDGSESLVLMLSGFPADATFSVGTLDAQTGHWVIDASDVASLATTLLSMTPPSNYNGNFTLHVDALVTDAATLSTGDVTDTGTFAHDIVVVVGAANDAPVILTNDLQTGGDDFEGTIVSQLSIADDQAEGVTVTVVAAHGTLAPVGGPSPINNSDGGEDGILRASGSLAAIDQMLTDGWIYSPNEDVPPTDMVTMTVADSLGGSDTVNFIFNQTGEGPVTLQGTALKDVIFATGYSDTLTGGAGADQFVFTVDSGDDTITDFRPGQDRIDLVDDNPFIAGDQVSFNNWLTSSGDVVEQEGGTLVTLGDDSILLSNISRSSLQMNDFILHPGNSA